MHLNTLIHARKFYGLKICHKELLTLIHKQINFKNCFFNPRIQDLVSGSKLERMRIETVFAPFNNLGMNTRCEKYTSGTSTAALTQYSLVI